MEYLSKMVIEILQNNAEARDDMMLVVKTIYDFELKALGKTKDDLYECLFSKKLSSIKTIDRIWRKVQEENESLRGIEWMLRQVQAGIISIEIVNNQLKLFK
jgi:hypothetical protein